jgi:hypothetical protein
MQLNAGRARGAEWALEDGRGSAGVVCAVAAAHAAAAAGAGAGSRASVVQVPAACQLLQYRLSTVMLTLGC